MSLGGTTASAQRTTTDKMNEDECLRLAPRNVTPRVWTHLGFNWTVLDLAVVGGVSERGYVRLTAGLQPRGGEERRRGERRPNDRAG